MLVSGGMPDTDEAANPGGAVVWGSREKLAVRRSAGNCNEPFRVLLAEDNPLDQLGIRRLLEKQGLAVTLAPDGRAAVSAFETGTFELVLLDILMPEMDGFEVAARIRALEEPRGTHIPIFALTAYALKAVYDKCRSVGMDGYLSKPVAGDDLKKLCEFLAMNSVPAPPQP